MPHLCMIFEATGPFNAIGRIAMAEVEAALEAGWAVSVVAHRLGDSLKGRVEWLPLYNPPRGFAVKWLTARHFIKKAMGDPSRFDLIHGHQPQIADLCDVFECHYLTRAAMERGCQDARLGLRGVAARLQESLVLRAEDRCFRSRNDETSFIFDSDLTRREFARLYGMPAKHDVQIYPAPKWDLPSDAERSEARRELAGDWAGPVVGFLGGMNERKGYRAVLDAVEAAPELFLVFAGQHSEQVKPGAALRGRFNGVGLVGDVARFYAGIDVLLVPSVFEPFGLVCFEAAARGVPVIATESVGALDTLEPYGLASLWDTASLGMAVHNLCLDIDRVMDSCRRLVSEYSSEAFNRNLMSRYDAVLASKK